MKTPVFIKLHKQKIDNYLYDFLLKNKADLKNHFQADLLFLYLTDFSKNGKSIRGSLFLEFLALSGKKEAEIDQYLPIAGALELIHSGLLIQDDWMDKDNFRRGQIALHSLLNKDAQANNIQSPERYSGEATNCASDIIFFLSFKMLTQATTDHSHEVITFIMNEYVKVGFAQWQDVYFSYRDEYQFSNIENIYLYKTARYTFVMPIIAALLACGEKAVNLKKIEQLAENIGMLYQITDDKLNIFGNPLTTKKAIGSDICDNKKTYYHFFYHQQLSTNKDKEYRKIKRYFGKKVLSDKDLQTIKNVLIDFGIEKNVSEIVDKYRQKCKEIINTINNKKYKNNLSSLIDYIVERDS